ncbi:hypothetical protein [Staphylococcus epidermidis]|uniref:hypothetical protein n=1 Tax=Staphylococcus epidermidis TaxID=1282 RepID=UPI00138DEC4F|nr:hypothetical protein [Staphylococcus epidermidis]MDS3947465.1 hypothetical protein [Staphylococcus epidermidis]
MEKLKTFFIGIMDLIIAVFIIFLLIVGFYNNNYDIFVGLCTLFTGILAIIGVCFTIFNSQSLKNKELLEEEKLKNRELLNELDQKSEWRKELMNIASKTFMTTDDIYRVLASLRYQPHNVGIDECDFKSMTKKIYEELNEMLDTKYNRKIKQKLSKKTCLRSKDYIVYIEYEDSEIIRLYTKYLLKHHWEINIDETEWLKNQGKVIKEVEELRDKI